jgi:hypothetical protein
MSTPFYLYVSGAPVAVDANAPDAAHIPLAARILSVPADPRILGRKYRCQVAADLACTIQPWIRVDLAANLWVKYGAALAVVAVTLIEVTDLPAGADLFLQVTANAGNATKIYQALVAQ